MKKVYYVVKNTTGNFGGGITERVAFFTNKKEAELLKKNLTTNNQSRYIIYWVDWEWMR
jgi:hypothetical protein